METGCLLHCLEVEETNVFEAVKQSVTTRQAALVYGISVGRNGMACCPFHDDRHPSMKVECSICGPDRPYDNGSWRCASKSAIEYMMDPRNSLDAAYIFQFQDLSSSVGDREAVKKMTENTFLYNDSYIDAIIEAAQTEGISPFHIVSRIKQEQGATGAGAMNGYLYRTKTGEFVKVYNLFNINVSGNDTEAGLLAGAQYAYDQQWFSVEASIKGGAKFIKKQYINQGQATLYFQKYNVVDSSNLFNHQYMQNIRAANDEGNTMYRAYLKNGILSSTFEFTIPVYENMPVLAVPRPQYIPVQKITTEQETYIIGVNEVIDINYGYLPFFASSVTKYPFRSASSQNNVIHS